MVVLSNSVALDKMLESSTADVGLTAKRNDDAMTEANTVTDFLTRSTSFFLDHLH